MTDEIIQQTTDVVAKIEQPIAAIESNPTADSQDEQQINWKKFREEREKERQARQEAERRATAKEAEAHALKEAMGALLSNSQAPTRGYSPGDDDDDEDVSIQKKVDAAFAKREQQYMHDRAQREQEELPATLKKNFSDFDKICTETNLDYLEFHYPEIAVAYKHMPEGVEKWGAIYKSIKKFVPNAASAEDRQKIERNLSKPQSASTSGVTQSGDTAPVLLDDKRRADNWARMQRVMKGSR